MKKKTIQWIIKIAGLAIDVLILIKDKMNGGKNGNKGNPKEK